MNAKKIVKGILIFASGAVTGGVIVYNYLNKKMIKKINSEIDNVKIAYGERLDELEAQYNEPTAKEEPAKLTEEERSVGLQKVSKILEEYTDYSSITSAGAEVKIEPVTLPSIDDEDPDNYAELYKDEPYQIPKGAFGMRGYEECLIKYFDEDGTFCDENEDILIGIVSSIGDTALDNDLDTIYIRNDMLEVDYKIVRYPGSYEKMIEEKYGREGE